MRQTITAALLTLLSASGAAAQLASPQLLHQFAPSTQVQQPLAFTRVPDSGVLLVTRRPSTGPAMIAHVRPNGTVNPSFRNA